MSEEKITWADLQAFRIQLLEDLKKILQPVEDKPEWVKSAEVRRMLKVSPGTLQNLRINGSLHPKKIHGSWYYSVPEIKKMFK